jgi:hypothetical protein
MTGIDDQWYWCLRHNAVEQGPGCPGGERYGPYPSADAAEHWRDKVAERNVAWDEEDRRWDGDV